MGKPLSGPIGVTRYLIKNEDGTGYGLGVICGAGGTGMFNADAGSATVYGSGMIVVVIGIISIVVGSC